ncbi:hypothetical protein K6L26_08760 [Mycolicibacterium farcinogenes]|uniref:Uncharacterized protein n=1 Tax=Mycolicibacterium farcinogenes TaxID=1802 RepID=A0ACD1FPR0_MYCFR|nr:hypothetical protein K6L26_08760 [Mycolicibacterium farcinogenes]
MAGLIREVDEVCRRAALYGSRISVLTDEHRDVVIVTDRDIASVDQDDDEPSVYKFTDSDGETIVGMIVEGGTVERHLDGTYIVQL